MKKVKKSGKKLEKLITMIQEFLKDSSNTVIHTNYKIPNSSNRKREIDILIESKLNGYSIKIAIECKEYNKPISVEKVEAFKGKCDRIVDINKKIMVSQNGYQADAINAAKDFEIELYKIEDINQDTIIDWLPNIIQLGLRFTIGKISVHLNCDEANDNIKTKDGLFHFYDERNAEPINSFVNNLLISENKSLWAHTLLNSKFQVLNEPKNKVNMPFEIRLSGVYIIDDNDRKIHVLGVESSVDTWFEHKNVTIEEANSFVNLKGEVKANNLSIPLGNEKANIILSENKYAIFHTDENGITQELKTIMAYNPKQI